jgi:hypothetical protein
VRGFKEVQNGIPMDYDAYYNSIRDREGYERGRQFGCVYKGVLKDGKNVTHEAQSALYYAFYSNSSNLRRKNMAKYQKAIDVYAPGMADAIREGKITLQKGQWIKIGNNPSAFTFPSCKQV